MEEDNPPPGRPYRIRRPSSSLISSTTSPSPNFPAPQPPPNQHGLGRSLLSRTNANINRDIDDDIQPSSSTPSFPPGRSHRSNNNHSHNNINPSSSNAGRSSSPLGSPDSTFWGPSPSPLNITSGNGSAGPPTPGGNCVVSSSTVDDVPPSPYSDDNFPANLMLPPLSSSGGGNGGGGVSSNAVSVISGSGNYNNNNSSSSNNNNNDLPGPSGAWEPPPVSSAYSRSIAASASSLLGNSLSFGASSFLAGGRSSFASASASATSSSSLASSSSASSSSSTGQSVNNNLSSGSTTVSSFNLSPVRSKIKKASSFERFSAQAQASSNNNTNNNNSNTSGNNSANSSNVSCASVAVPTVSTPTTVTTLSSNQASISNAPAATIPPTGAMGSSRLLWDYVPSTAATTGSGVGSSVPMASASSSSSRLTSTASSSVSGILNSTLSESFNSTKPFHLKKLAAKIASVFEQEQLIESAASFASLTQSQGHQQHSTASGSSIDEGIGANSQDNSMGQSSAASTSRNTVTAVPTKSFLTKNIPLTPKQKLLQRLQSGELFDTTSPPPALPAATIPLDIQPSVPSAPILQSTIQQQHQILLSSLQQPPTTSAALLVDSIHLQQHQQQHETLMAMTARSPTPPPLSPPCTSPTPRASAELERYVSSMSVSNYEAFMRASGDDFAVQDSLGKNIDPEDLSNIQVLYDPTDPYTYYYGNILVDEMDFTTTGPNPLPGTASTSGNSSSSVGRQLLVVPPNSGGLDDSTFQSQQQQQHGHLEFVLGGVNSLEDSQRQHELRDEDLQLGELSHHQSFLDPNDNGLSLSLGKSQSQAESTLRNLLMMDPLRPHDDSWISAATAAEYQNRLNNLGGVRGINLNASGGSGGAGSSSSLNLSNSWINDWPSRSNNSWQPSHHDLVGEQNEVMDMSVLDMTDKGNGKRQSLCHNNQGQNGLDEDVDLGEENSSSGLSLLVPMDLQQPLPLSLSLTSAKYVNENESEPINLQHPHPHQHSHHRTRTENQDDDEPVNLMAVVNLENELGQTQGGQSQSHHHSQEMCQGQGQVQNSNPVYSTFLTTTAPPKVLSPPSTNFNHNFEVSSQSENMEERKLILIKKNNKESLGDLLGSKHQQQMVLMSNALSPSSTSSTSGTPGLAVTNVIPDKPVKPRAYASLPSILSFSRLTEDGCTIVTNRNKLITPNTRFGPVEGPLRKVYQEDLDMSDAIYPCLIMVDNTNTYWQLDRSDDDVCNWMKFVRLAHSPQTQNILISEINGFLFFTTCRDIPPKAELQAGYDLDYARQYGLQYLEPVPNNESDYLEAEQEPEQEQEPETDTEKAVESYPCFECNVEYFRAEDLDQHIQSEHREPEIQPKKKAAIKKYLYSKTANSIKKAKTIVSSTKSKKFRSLPPPPEPDMSLGGTILCKHCGGVYLNLDELKSHLKDSAACGRTGNVEVLVLKPQEPPKDEDAETTTAKLPLPKPKPKAKCPVCYKGFATKDRLEKHMLVHNAEELKPLKCNFCAKRFLTNSALAGHVKTHAEEGKCFECPMCNFATQQLLSLKEHVQTHKNKENGMFHCPRCEKKFTMYSMVRKHIRAFHGPRQFLCDHCPMNFSSGDKLKLHKLKHSDHREFLCAECGRQFKRKDKLREHTRRMHENKTKPPPIPPEVLQLVPIRKEKMIKKLNPKVSEEQFSKYMFKCNDCMLGFKRRGMLVNHLAKRHPDKPPQQVPELNLPILRPSRNYLCPYCDRIYKSSSKRKSHILKSHPGKQVPPQLRGKGGISVAKQKSGGGGKTDNLPVITVRMGGSGNGPPVELFSLASKSTATVTVPAMTAVDDNGVSGNVVVSRRDPIVASPHGCQWCHRQYATRAKLLQHQRKSHLHLMPVEIQTPRPQKNNVSRAPPAPPTFTLSVTDMTPLNPQTTLELINSSPQVYSALDHEMLGNHSDKITTTDGNGENGSVIAYLLTTTTVSNGNFENTVEPEILMMSSLPHGHGQNNPGGSASTSMSANDLDHQNIVSVNHNMISTTGLNLNLNPILTKTDD